ncbi:hypothetical protein ACROYT_G030434 [Oculina patagonica]
MAIFPMGTWLAFVIVTSWFYGIASVTTSVPSTVYIDLSSNKSNSQAWSAFQLAIKHVNSDSSLLPNTTMAAFDDQLTTNHDMFDYAIKLLKSNVVSLLVDSPALVTHEALSTMLRIPMVTTHMGSSPSDSAKQSTYHIKMAPSLGDITEAIRGIINYYKWTSLLVLYDVRWRHLAHDFVSRLPPKSKVSKLSLELDHHDNDGQLCEETKRKLTGFNDAPIEAFVLLLEYHWVEDIINQVHCSCSLKIEKPHNWLLADPVSSSGMTVQSSQVVMGFQPYSSNSHMTERLVSELSSQHIKDSSRLIYDAVWTVAHALHAVISSGKWKNDSTNGTHISHNGDAILEHLKKVVITGTTDLIQFNDSGSRINSKLDVRNLRDDKFVTIGQWSSSQNKLELSSTPQQNKQTSGLVPLDKLNRRLKVVVVKDAPFVMENKDGKLEGFSIDLIEKIAEMLSFRYEVYESPDGLYGGWNEEKGYTGIVGEITKNNADLSTSPLTINSERLQVLEFSKPFMQFTMSLISKKVDTNDHDLTTFMLPYSTTVWLVTLACLLFVTILMYLVNLFSPYGHRSRHMQYGETGEEFNFFNSLWFCLASMLQQGADHTPKSFSGRVLAGCFWFCILIWISTYTANLAAFFTVRNSERQINTLEDVVEGDYPFYVMRDSAIHQFFRVAEYHTYRKLWERMNAADTFVNSTAEGYGMARKIENAVFMAEKPSTEYIIMQKPCDLRTVNGILGAGSYGIAMPKHSPYIRNISVAILKLQETSVLDSLWRKWWEYKSQCPKEKSGAAVGDSKRIQLENMLGVYLVLAAGGCFSVIVVLVEIWWRKHGTNVMTVLRTKYSFMREKSSTVIRVQPSTVQAKSEDKDDKDHNDEGTPC